MQDSVCTLVHVNEFTNPIGHFHHGLCDTQHARTNWPLSTDPRCLKYLSDTTEGRINYITKLGADYEVCLLHKFNT